MTGHTNWSPYDVPQLAGILNDNLDTAWDQVFAWLNAQAMLDDASSTLAAARQGLADVWPPESSPAAQTFFKVVDDLTESMRQTSLASNTNASALANVLDNHVSTQSNIDQLNARWAMLKKLESADPAGLDPTDQWRSSLNAEAQQHMATADAVINEYAATLVVPPVISVPTTVEPVTILPENDGTPTSGQTSAGGNVTARSDSSAAGQGPISGRPVGGETGPGVLGVPVLTGTTAPIRGEPALSPSAPGTPAPGAPAGPHQVSPTHPVLPTPVMVPGQVGQPVMGAVRSEQAAGPRSISETTVAVDAGRAQGMLDADGTLRPAPPSGTRAGSSATDPTSTELVRGNPTPGETEALMPPMMAGGGAGGGRRTRRRLAESIWYVPTGGPAVLTPAYETDIHDPGPGVIGIDR